MTNDQREISASVYMLKTDVVDCRALRIVYWAAKSIGEATKVRKSATVGRPNFETDPLCLEGHKNPVRLKKTNHSIDSSNKNVLSKWRKYKPNEEGKFVCSVCTMEFLKPQEYKRHMVKHSDLRPYKCKICEKAFKRSSELSNHKQVHRAIKYACETCGFTTINKFSLRMHHRRVHERDFRYHCDQCDKSFMSNCDLEDHKASHLGKTFVCDICGSAHAQSKYLVTHKRISHGIQKGTRKEFQCNVCHKGFSSEHNLNNHIVLHSQMFLCAECGKEFTTNHSLKLHTRMHTGEKPYKCKVCLKTFARSVSLRVHKLTHTGERPYLCDLCGQNFTQRSSMMVHRRKHPGSHPPPPPLLLSKLEKNEHKD